MWPTGALARQRTAAGLLRVLREWAHGWLGARGLQQRVQRQWRTSVAVAALWGGGVSPLARRGGCGAVVPLAGLPLSVGRGGEGRDGGRGGDSPLSLSGPPVMLFSGCGGVAWWPWLQGATH